MTDPNLNPTPSPAQPPAHHQPPPGAPIMNAVRWVLFGGLLLLAAISIGSYVAWRRSTTTQTTQKKQALYHCPMHPSYTSDRPGQCPICGMDLEPIPTSTSSATAGGDGNVPGLTTVELSPERIQMIGVRTTVVARRALGSGLELVGFVTPDESRIHRVQLRVAGWVQRVHGAQTGGFVRAGQPLLDLYSPELFQSEQEFLIETGLRDTMSHGAPMAMSHDDPVAARRRLELMGVPANEIARLERERKASSNLTLTSPVSGTVLERLVSDGQSVSPDSPLFTIADLRRVWVMADLYEMDVARVRPGASADFTADAIVGRRFGGRVELVSPTVSSETRTVKARIALDNPNGTLRPGMFGKVRMAGAAAPVLVVPAEAVVDAGAHRYVFLARAGGRFEPREVRTGATAADGVEIVTGLAAGDTVVASASFLIDSESRLKAAISGMSAPSGHSGH